MRCPKLVKDFQKQNLFWFVAIQNLIQHPVNTPRFNPNDTESWNYFELHVQCTVHATRVTQEAATAQQHWSQHWEFSRSNVLDYIKLQIICFVEYLARCFAFRIRKIHVSPAIKSRKWKEKRPLKNTSVQHVGSVNGAKFSSHLVFIERIFFCYTGIRCIISHVCKSLSQVINSDVFLWVVVHFVADWLFVSRPPGYCTAVMTTKMFTGETVGVWVLTFEGL